MYETCFQHRANGEVCREGPACETFKYVAPWVDCSTTFVPEKCEKEKLNQRHHLLPPTFNNASS